MPSLRARVMSLPNGDRRVLAALVAFLGAAYVPSLWFAMNSPGLASATDLVVVLGMSIVFMWFSAIFTAVFAAPAFIILLRVGHVRLWSSVSAGALLGIVVAAIVPLSMSSPYYESAVRESAPSFARVGAVAGAVFFVLLLGASRILRVSSPLSLKHGL